MERIFYIATLCDDNDDFTFTFLVQHYHEHDIAESSKIV